MEFPITCSDPFVHAGVTIRSNLFQSEIPEKPKKIRSIFLILFAIFIVLLVKQKNSTAVVLLVTFTARSLRMLVCHNARPKV